MWALQGHQCTCLGWPKWFIRDLKIYLQIKQLIPPEICSVAKGLKWWARSAEELRCARRKKIHTQSNLQALIPEQLERGEGTWDRRAGWWPGRRGGSQPREGRTRRGMERAGEQGTGRWGVKWRWWSLPAPQGRGSAPRPRHCLARSAPLGSAVPIPVRAQPGSGPLISASPSPEDPPYPGEGCGQPWPRHRTVLAKRRPLAVLARGSFGRWATRGIVFFKNRCRIWTPRVA